jgi:hypothetical protein
LPAAIFSNFKRIFKLSPLNFLNLITISCPDTLNEKEQIAAGGASAKNIVSGVNKKFGEASYHTISGAKLGLS